MARLHARPDACDFWATHEGAERDLLIVRGKRRWRFEIKRASSPAIAPSMRTALDGLKLQRHFVMHDGHRAFHMAKKIRAVPVTQLLEKLRSW